MTKENGQKKFSRRRFLKYALLAAGGGTLVACAPQLVPPLTASATPLSVLNTEPSTSLPSATVTNTSLPTKPPPATPDLRPSLTPAPKEWKLSRAERVEMMAKPEFFTELQGNNKRNIITRQFDKSEYEGMKRNVHHNNTCGEATLATIAKMYAFLNTGKVPDIIIAGICAKLDKKTFKDIKGKTATYIVDSNDLMWFVGLPDALKFLIPQLNSTIEYVTPNRGMGDVITVPKTDWPEVLSNAQTICGNGGFLITFCYKHGFTHIILTTDVKTDGTATIVDTYDGIAKKMRLEDYFDVWNGQPSLFGMIGITPQLS